MVSGMTQVSSINGDAQAVAVSGLTRRFGDFTAVNALSFTVPKGKIIGLLGPNGAGKTTTIQMLLGITLQTSGSIEYFGKDFRNNRQESLQRINFSSAFNTLQGKITARENLMVFGSLYQTKNLNKKIENLAGRFEVSELLDVEYYKLSVGQQTRINLMKALINDPELILMDEPTASLDPDIADKILTLIEKLQEDKKISILYTSHNMSEVERICDEVIIMDKGKIVAQDTPLGLTKRITHAKLQITFDGKQSDVHAYLKAQHAKHTFRRDNTVLIDTNEKDIPKLIFKLSELGVWITDIEIKKPTLENVFLEIARGNKK